MKKYLLGILFTLLLSVNAFAADMTIFGIELGKPLKLPECEKEKNYSGYEYKVTTGKMCYQKDGFTLAATGNTKQIMFPEGESPWYTRVNVIELNGSVEGAELWTLGVHDQNRVLQELTSKYGKPVSLEKRKVQNGFGASFDSVVATWAKNGVNISFTSVFTSANMGRVTISTDKLTRETDKMFKESGSKMKKL